MTRARVAFALFCGLAVCCAMMYITSDAGDETAYASVEKASNKGDFVHNIGGPSSVDSTDVQKAGWIFTNTPDGRMRLQDYLDNVEKKIEAETSARKRDVANVRAQMERNEAFNAAARSKLKKRLLARMEKNAKKAKRDLARAMRWVQSKFAKAAEISNKRKASNIKRSKALRARAAAYKREARRQLNTAVIAQQRAMAAYKSAINRRIRQTDKAVHKNAAQIISNAKAAEKALNNAVSLFDRKAMQAAAGAAAGRSKLRAQLLAQDKATRAMANNKLKVAIMKTAAHFRRVRMQMAKDRSHADFALKTATTRFTASLDAFKALNTKRFAKTVKDIKAARAEAKQRVGLAKAEFFTKIRLLQATVKTQVSKTNARIDQLSGVVQKHKYNQAKVNSNVRAEMDRMIKIGKTRYEQHLKKDRELRALVKANKAATDARLKAMANHYSAQLGAIQKQMKRNRAHASRRLATETSKLYSAISKSEKAQMKINGKLATQTRRARIDIATALRSAKDDFANRMSALHKVVTDNDKKYEKKMDSLTGIVRANAIKNRQGRELISASQKANRLALQNALSAAIRKGERRMQAAENKLVGLNKKTKAALNVRIVAQISALKKSAERSINNLRMESKAARAEMKKQLFYAVDSMAREAKKNLVAAKATAAKMYNKAFQQQAMASEKNAAARAKLAKSIATEKKIAQRTLDAAVATMERSMLALKTQTRKSIKKTNGRVDKWALQIKTEAREVRGLMKAQLTKLSGDISTMRAKSKSAISKANTKSAAGFSEVNKKIAAAFVAARKKSAAKFSKLFEYMAKERAKADAHLKSTINILNDKIAKQAALEDSRFRKTVKDIKKARADAAKEVKKARQEFGTAIITATSKIKAQEKRLMGEIAVVSGMQVKNTAQQRVVNRRTQKEMGTIRKTANERYSKSKRARGRLARLLDENKKAAQQEVQALDKLFTSKLNEVRKKADSDAKAAGNDLKKKTKALYTHLAAVQLEALANNKKNSAEIVAYGKKSQAAIKEARAGFNSSLNQLANKIVAHRKKTEKGLSVISGVIRHNKANGKRARALIRKQNKALGADLNAQIAKFIQQGEAQAKAIADRARSRLARSKRALLVEISSKVESTADNLFKMIQGNHKTIADNYLSMKAYSSTASDKLVKYVTNGKGKNLSSIGDLLINVAALSKVKPSKSLGIGAGSKKIKNIFSMSKIPVQGSYTLVNGLVNEYTSVTNACRLRWPMGLGKYLLGRLEASMLKKGVLQVDKLQGKPGNYVFMNGRALGLSNKLNSFEDLAVQMHKYEANLSKMTAKIAGKWKVKKGKYVNPPQWDGK
jgi:hypothetical protein